MLQNKSIRILGLAEEPQIRQGEEFIAKDKFFTSLNQAFDVIDVGVTRLTGRDRYLNILRSFSSDREFWGAKMGANLKAFDKRTALAEQYLNRYQGQFDLVIQHYCQFAPGYNLDAYPYVTYTDNTYLLSERYSSTWKVLKKKQDRDEWVRRETEIYNKAKFVFTWSEFARQSIVEDYGVPPERVINAKSGANLKSTDLSGKTYDSQIALFVGKDFHRKGGQALLEAWREVRAALPGAELWIAGQRRYPRLGLPPGIKWLGLINDRQKLAEIYNRASVFVLPSVFDPCPLVLKEAMGLGLPCVSTRQCAVPEFVEDGKTGLLVPPGDSGLLADALIELLGSPGRAETLGRQAHQSVQQGHSWQNVIERMFPYLQEAVLNNQTSLAS